MHTHNMSTRYFLRVTSHPEADMDRGISYQMGCFGDAEFAEPGLSGFRADGCGVDELAAYWSSRSCAHSRAMVVLFAGYERGVGSDLETCYGAKRVVRAWSVERLATAEGCEELQTIVDEMVNRGE